MQATDPFPVGEVHFRAAGTFKGRTTALVYIDARSVQRRLDAVDPNWAGEHGTPVVRDAGTKEKNVYGGGTKTVALEKVAVPYRLTVQGVARTDVGESVDEVTDEKAFKTAYSDAVKRAAVNFGIGAYLYDLPPFSVAVSEVDYGRISPRALAQLQNDYVAAINGEAPPAPAPEQAPSAPAPRQTPAPAAPSGGFTLTFGKHKGKSLTEVPEDYIEWLVNQEGDPKYAQQDAERKAAYSAELARRKNEAPSDLAPDTTGIDNLQTHFSATAQDDQIPF